MKYRVQLGKKYYPKKKEVKVINVGSQPKTTPDYNPYQPVDLLVGTASTSARPTQFDSEPVDKDTLVNSDGCTIKPVKFISTCPHCGHAIEVECHDYMPGNVLVASCENCGVGTDPAPPALSDPFWNPVEAGIVKDTDLDPSLSGLDALATLTAPAIINPATDTGNQGRPPGPETGGHPNRGSPPEGHPNRGSPPEGHPNRGSALDMGLEPEEE